jgi:hypothetical protein
MPAQPRTTSFLLAAPIAALALAACGRSEPPAATPLPSAAEAAPTPPANPSPTPAAPSPAPGQQAPAAPVQPEAAAAVGQGGLAWTLPAGWSESRPGGMRYATLKPDTPGTIDGSVIALPGPAGGELANVNRWRGQIGLPPFDDAGLSAARKLVQSPAGQVAVFDFATEGEGAKRMIAGVVVAGGQSWFVKLTGDAAPMAAAAPAFQALLASLKF